jgi:hypothetical protein
MKPSQILTRLCKEAKIDGPHYSHNQVPARPSPEPASGKNLVGSSHERIIPLRCKYFLTFLRGLLDLLPELLTAY